MAMHTYPRETNILDSEHIDLRRSNPLKSGNVDRDLAFLHCDSKKLRDRLITTTIVSQHSKPLCCGHNRIPLIRLQAYRSTNNADFEYQSISIHTCINHILPALVPLKHHD